MYQILWVWKKLEWEWSYDWQARGVLDGQALAGIDGLLAVKKFTVT